MTAAYTLSAFGRFNQWGGGGCCPLSANSASGDAHVCKQGGGAWPPCPGDAHGDMGQNSDAARASKRQRYEQNYDEIRASKRQKYAAESGFQKECILEKLFCCAFSEKGATSEASGSENNVG